MSLTVPQLWGVNYSERLAHLISADKQAVAINKLDPDTLQAMPYATIPNGRRFHFKTGDGQAEAYIDKNKPTLVLLHPCVMDSTFFQPQLSCSKLTDRCNLIALDSHYHGLTKVPLEETDVEGETPYNHIIVATELISVLDVLQIGQCHLFGANLGAYNAIRMATIQPQRFLSLFLSAIPPTADEKSDVSEYHAMREDCIRGAGDGSDTIPPGIIDAGRFVFYGQFRQGTSKYWREYTNFRPSNPKHINKIFSVVLDRGNYPDFDWAKLTCPVMIVQGSEDNMNPPAAVKKTFDRLVNAPKEMRVVEGGPHLISRTHTDAVHEWLMDFIDGRAIATKAWADS